MRFVFCRMKCSMVPVNAWSEGNNYVVVGSRNETNAPHFWQIKECMIREDEHDACGVGFIAALDGKPRRDVVQAGIDALKAVWHRGAVDADGKTGDGAGIHIEIPQDFFADAIERGGARVMRRPDRRRPGVSAARPISARRSAAGRSSRPKSCNFGYHIYGWRQVPINVDVHRREGQRHAARDRTDHDLERQGQWPRPTFERDLYVIRRRIEKAGDRPRKSRNCISVRCRAARSSTRACSWPRA